MNTIEQEREDLVPLYPPLPGESILYLGIQYIHLIQFLIPNGIGLIAHLGGMKIHVLYHCVLVYYTSVMFTAFGV